MGPLVTAIPAVRLADHAAAMRETFTLPPGRTVAEALAVAQMHRRIIWRQPANSEDERIGRLIKQCVKLCCGDAESGERLAQRVIWTHGQ